MKRHYNGRKEFKFAYSVCPKCGDAQVGWYRRCIKCNTPTEMENRSVKLNIDEIIPLLEPKYKMMQEKKKTVKHMTEAQLTKRRATVERHEEEKRYAKFKEDLEKIVGKVEEDDEFKNAYDFCRNKLTGYWNVKGWFEQMTNPLYKPDRLQYYSQWNGVKTYNWTEEEFDRVSKYLLQMFNR